MELFSSRRWRLDRPKQKAVVFMLNRKINATHAWHNFIVVWLLGLSSSSSPYTKELHDLMHVKHGPNARQFHFFFLFVFVWSKCLKTFLNKNSFKLKRFWNNSVLSHHLFIHSKLKNTISRNSSTNIIYKQQIISLQVGSVSTR